MAKSRILIWAMYLHRYISAMAISEGGREAITEKTEEDNMGFYKPPKAMFGGGVGAELRGMNFHTEIGEDRFQQPPSGWDRHQTDQTAAAAGLPPSRPSQLPESQDFFTAPVDNNLLSTSPGGGSAVTSYLAAYPPPPDEPLRYRPAPPPEAQYNNYQHQRRVATPGDGDQSGVQSSGGEQHYFQEENGDRSRIDRPAEEVYGPEGHPQGQGHGKRQGHGARQGHGPRPNPVEMVQNLVNNIMETARDNMRNWSATRNRRIESSKEFIESILVKILPEKFQRRQDVLNTSGALVGMGVLGASSLFIGEVVDLIVKSFVSNQLNALNFFL